MATRSRKRLSEVAHRGECSRAQTAGRDQTAQSRRVWGCREARGGAEGSGVQRRGGAVQQRAGRPPVTSAHFRESRELWPPPARSCQLAGAGEPVSAQARPQPSVCAARATVRHHGGVGAAAARRDHGGPGLRQGHRVVTHHQTLRAEAPLQWGPPPPEHAAGHRWELRPRAGRVRCPGGALRAGVEGPAALPDVPWGNSHGAPKPPGAASGRLQGWNQEVQRQKESPRLCSSGTSYRLADTAGVQPGELCPALHVYLYAEGRLWLCHS